MRHARWLLLCFCLISVFLLSELTADTPKWEVVKSPVEVTLRGVFFGDENTAFAVGDDGTVIASKDAGKTWQKQESESKANLRGVHFTDKDHGWACGDGDPDAPSASPSGGHVLSGKPLKRSNCLITSDGGKNWESVWLNTNFELRSIWMASKKLGQICAHGSLKHPDGDLYKTTDGGKTWKIKRVYRGLNDCCWAGKSHAWSVGNRNGGRGLNDSLLQRAHIIHTSDGGKEWKVQKSVDLGGWRKELYSVWFADKKFGCAVGDPGAILMTSDGGKNWKLCDKVTDKALYAVCFVDKEFGWAVGKAGTILATTDGGKKWKKVKSPTDETLYSLHLNKDGKVIIAVGEKGTIIRIE